MKGEAIQTKLNKATKPIGRFKTIDEALDFYSNCVQQSINIDPKMEFSHQGGAHLTTEEKRNIIAFLATLTDSAFISNPEFSNPFENY